MFLLALLLAQPRLQAQSSFTVVSAASYQPAVAPGSLASMFGANLAPETLSATLDSQGQLPTVLSGISVEVDGKPAPLIFVSPLQINFVIPDGIASGSIAVVVRSGDGSAARTGSVLVQSTAPGLFTSDASGQGPGSILNAVTYAGPPFLVVTSANGGADLRTRLSVYGTGLRNATTVKADALDSSNQRYSLAVEYADAAPGYFGLDQVNLVLPAELDGAGAVSLTITADARISNTVTFQVGSLPPDAITLQSLSLSQPAVIGGDSVSGTVSLNAPARAAGFPVSLRVDNPAVQIPLSVVIPAGKTSAAISVTTSAVPSLQTATITAQANGATRTATLELDPSNLPRLTDLRITPSSVQGGRSATGTLVLNSAPAAGGAVVQLSSDDDAAQPPATVVVPFGATTATFSIPTTTVKDTRTATLTATYGRATLTAPLTLLPAIQLSLRSNVVVGGNSVSGTVTLGEPAGATGVTLNLQCDNRTIAQPPLSVTIPSGQTSATFTVTTTAVSLSRTVTISVSLSGLTQSVSLAVNPPGTASLANLTLSPDHVTGGANSTGTVTLGAAAPAGGIGVNILSTSAFATVPAFVTVGQGQTSAIFTITTSKVSTPQTVTITGSAGGVSKTATLTVQ